MWSTKSGKERKQILHRVADLIVERAHAIAVTECVDTGQTMRFMSAAALRGADNFRFFADQAPSMATASRCPPPITSITRPPSPWPGGSHHAMEHPVHVEYLEDRARARRWLHRRSQTGRVVPAQLAATR